MRWQEFPIVGGAYKDDTRPWSCQDTVNYMPVMAERPGGRSPSLLRGVPGLVALAQLENAPVRGLHNAEGLLLAVVGNSLYRIAGDGGATNIGTIPGVGRVSMAHNQITYGNQVAIATGSTGYVYDTTNDQLSPITDEAFPGAISFDFIDGYITGIEPGRRFAFFSDLADAFSYNALDRLQAESSPDRLVGQIISHREWWLFGERTVELYQNTGAATGTFQRAEGVVIEVGCASGATIANLDNSVFWLGNDGVVYRANGYTPQRVSTHAIEQDISRCNTAQAFAFTWVDRGHSVYYLTFPDGHTWGYDVAANEWHRRQSEKLDRWRINDVVRWNNQWVAGDYTNGNLYTMDWVAQHENGAILERRRTAGVLHDSQNAVVTNGLEIVVDTGQPGLGHLEIHGALGNGTVGQAVDFRYTASGGIPGYAFRIAGGSLPGGLTMDDQGRVTGAPTTAGDYMWTVQAVDALGSVATLDDSCNVSIPPKNPIYIGYQNFPVDQFFQNDGSGGVLQTQPKSTAFGTYTSNSRGDLYTSQYGGAKIYRMVKDQQGIYSSIEQNINGYPFVSVKGMGISPSGAKLILCSGTTEESPGICLFSAQGEESFELDHTFVMYPNDPYESYMTTRISFSPDGSKVILWGSYSGDAWTLWDISGSTPQRLFGSASDGNSGSDVAWRPDGTKFIVAGSRQAVIYGIGVGDAVGELWSGGFDFYELTGSYRNIIAWSSEDVIFCGGTYTAYPLGVIYDVKSGSPVQVGTFDALNGPSNVVLSPDSSKLAISKYGGMKVYDVSGSTVTPSVSGDEGMDLISHL